MGRMQWAVALAVAAGMAVNAGAAEPAVVSSVNADARIELERGAQREALLRERARYPALFARAYRAYPQIPRGTLEAVAWAQSRWQSLEAASDGDAGHHHMPTAWGVMGLYAGDGFADQVGEAAALTGVPAERVKRDPAASILAAAALLARELRGLDADDDAVLAQALAPRIRVVGVAPGLTLPSYLQDDAAFAHAHRTLSPLGASSTAQDVADTVVFAMKTRSITGTTLLVDGGQHLLGLPRDASLMDGTPPTGR